MRPILILILTWQVFGVAFAQTKVTETKLGGATVQDDGINLKIFGRNLVVPGCTGCGAAANAAVDPISYGAAGVISSTTGTISASSHTLTVASASGWTIGMGIAIHNAGTGGTAELVTSVTAISGSTFTLTDAAITTATTQVVNHDDTAAIRAALTVSLAAGRPVHLSAGNYNITCSGAAIFTISRPTSFVGDGAGLSVLWDRCADQDVFRINYEIQPTDARVGVAALFSDFQISQVSDVTPTAGYGFHVASASGAGHYVSGLVVQRIQSNQIYGLVYAGTGILTAWFDKLFCFNNASTYCIVDNVVGPGGDIFWNDINTNNVSGQNGGVLVEVADTQEFSNIKVNGASFHIKTGTSTVNVQNLRILNPSIEGGQLQLIATGGTISNVSVVGGEFGFYVNSIAATDVSGLTISGTHILAGSATPAIALHGGNTSLTGVNFDANGVMVSLTDSAKAVITGCNVHQDEYGSGTYFVQTDNTITGGLVMSGNHSVLPNNFHANSLVPANQIPAMITATNPAASCTLGSVWSDANYIYSCVGTSDIRRAALSSFSVPGFSLVQHVSKTNCAAGSATCTLTASATGAGHLLVFVGLSYNPGGHTLGNYSTASGDGSWSHCPASYTHVAGGSSQVWGDCAYILSAAGGATSFTLTWDTSDTSSGWAIELLEYSVSAGTVTYDTGGQTTSASCTSCTAPALTLAGLVHLVVQFAFPPTGTISAISGSYTDPADVAVSVAGWINATDGTAPTWTNSAGAVAMGAVAFQAN